MINLRWPATKRNYLCPWYLIAYKSIFWPVIYIGMAVTWFALLMSCGYSQAKDWWRSAT